MVEAFCFNTTANSGTNPENPICVDRITARRNLCAGPSPPDPDADGVCTAVNLCIDDPFTPNGLCGSSIFNQAKTTRVAACRPDPRTPDVIPVVDGIDCNTIRTCILDPFTRTDLCRSSAFDLAKSNRRNSCLDDEPDNPRADCMNAKVLMCDGRSEYHSLYAPICSQQPDIALQRRIACYFEEDLIPGDSCYIANEQAGAAAEVWQYTAVAPDGKTSLNIVQDINDAVERVNFLAGPVVADDTDLDATLREDLGGISILVNTRTLGDTGLHGDAEDGAFFFGAQVSQQDRAYAGILASTNLGVPLVAPTDSGKPTTLTWTGRIMLQSFHSPTGPYYRGDNLELIVDLTASTITSKTSITNPLDTITFAINGKFNSLGVLYGTTTLTRNQEDYK
ncbi:MAG: hypothetical protein K8953_07250, partial [Proteobacteria bacterium]|nr:hypothetical protein [Pseudomonadota bacterium]